VVAECVETPSEAEFLRSHACDEFQGYFINNPMPADQFAELMGNPAMSENSGQTS
jgi:EAL domain-containing protein (putative c-di-GMP-specific phosphodiesterase class I)